MVGKTSSNYSERKTFQQLASLISAEMFEDSGVKSGIEFEVFGEILRESLVNEDILSI